MPVVSLIDHNDPKLSQKEAMMKVHECTGIYFSHFKKNDKGWAAHLHTDEDKVKLMSLEFRKQLREENIEILKSPDYKAACSIFIVSHQGTIFRMEDSKEFEAQFALAANTEVECLAILNSGKISIELTSPEEVARVRQQTVIMEGERFEPVDMEPQRFIKVIQCSKCYSFAHERADCTETQQHCFICGEAGHTNDVCPLKDNPRCKNCWGNHVAIAFKCPFRKVRLHELDPEQFGVSSYILRIVYYGQCRAAGVTPEDLDGEQLRRVRVGVPNPLLAFAGSTVETESESEGATAPSPRARETPTNVEINEVDFREILRSSLREAYRNAHSEVADLSPEGRTTVEDDDDDEEDEDAEEDEEQHPASSTWRSVRIVRAPNPEIGEGPRRQLRKIPNFKQQIPDAFSEKDPMTDYPILPKRKLRRCAVSEKETQEDVRNLYFIN